MGNAITADPITASDILTGAEIEPPCEHPDHGTDSPFHADGNPHYVRFAVSPCGYKHGPDGIVVVCGEWVRTIRGYHCGDCNTLHDVRDIMTDLGPVSDFA